MCYKYEWTLDPETSELSEYLKELNVKVHTFEECQVIWEDFRPDWVDMIKPEHVCLAGPDVGSCNVSIFVNISLC